MLGQDGVDLGAGLADVGRGRQQGREVQVGLPARTSASGRPVVRRRRTAVGDGVVRRARARGTRPARRSRPRRARAPAAADGGGHPGGVHPQRGQALREPGRGRADGAQQVGERRPLACQAPAARSCSCSIAANSVADQAGRAAGAGAGGDRRDRVAACAAWPTSRPGVVADLGDLADLGLRQQHDVDARSWRPPPPPRRARRRGRRSAAARCATATALVARPSSSASASRSATPGAASSRPACRPRRRTGPAARPRTSASRSRAPSSPASQPAALSPNVVGSACCISVRPMTTSSRWAAGQRAAAAAAAGEVGVDRGDRVPGQQHQRGVERRPGWSRRRARRPRGVGPDRVLQRAAPAAAPDCRRRPPSPTTVARSRRGRVGAGRGRPRRRPSSAPARRRAAARASAASTSSSARNHASSVTAAAAPPRAKVPSKRPLTRASGSQGVHTVPGQTREEDGLARRPAAGCRSGSRRRSGVAISVGARARRTAATAARRPRRWRRPRRRSRSG